MVYPQYYTRKNTDTDSIDEDEPLQRTRSESLTKLQSNIKKLKNKNKRPDDDTS